MKKIIFFISLSICMSIHLFASDERRDNPIFNLNNLSIDFSSDINDALLSQLKVGNAKNIARYFASSMTLSILNEDGLYSKFQAEMLLNDFFSKNKPNSVKLLQKITNNSNYNYYVYSLSSNKSLFRIFVKVSSAKNAETIEEFRVEKQAAK
ncbi:DUF4783 domain-containing protein [Sphingobacterium sp. SRCM116780]|uniref:DUF4783 domain-containing protein n=1 Tax=Sphingobacterium sp. SRCM116780 TaxID=2907623 RepID=UPI001F15F4BA|nr:DUF4783 domain-containing protein [Sphingobacterium sp. SRCM116780]UIR57609.1 DUF4783 domain-containing protein [Sphingobacterium sp. SRCM116780]